jgi:hypothetical protein
MAHLLLIGCIVAALVALFFLASRFEVAAAGLLRLSRLSNLIGWVLRITAQACKQTGAAILPKSLRAGESDTEQSDTHSLVSYVIARVLYLGVALAVFIGDFPLTRLRGVALFGIPMTNNGSLPLDIVNGILWIAVPILCWATVWDLWEQMPESYRIFPRLQPSTHSLVKVAQVSFRLLFALASLGFLILAIIVSAYFLLWGQLLQLAHQSAVELGLYVSLGFGLLVYFTAGMAFIALISGVLGLVAAVLWFVSLILNAGAMSAGLVGDTMKTSASQEPQVVPPPFPSVPVATPSALSQNSTPRLQTGYNPLLLPQGGRSPEQITVGHTPSSQEDIFMANLRSQNITTINLGTFGYRFAPAFAHACKDVGADGLIRLRAQVDLARPKDGLYRRGSLIGKDITPFGEIEHISATSSSPQQAYTQLMHTIGKHVVDSFTSVPVVKGFDVIAADLSLLPSLSEPVRELHRRQPGHAILFLTAVSERTLQEEDIDEAFECLQTLTGEGVIQNALLVHTRSPFATRVGIETQEEFLAKALASLLVAHEQYHYNPTFGEVFEQCRRVSPCTVLSFASTSVAAGKPTVGQNMVNSLRSKDQQVLGKGDLYDSISQTLSLFREIDNPSAFAMTSQGSIGEPLYILVNQLFRLDDRRFPQYVSSVQPQLGQTHPNTDLIVVRGSGTPESKDKAGYYIQCSAFRPLLFAPQEEEQQATGDTPQPAESLQSETAPVQVNGRRSRKQQIG